MSFVKNLNEIRTLSANRTRASPGLLPNIELSQEQLSPEEDDKLPSLVTSSSPGYPQIPATVEDATTNDSQPSSGQSVSGPHRVGNTLGQDYVWGIHGRVISNTTIEALLKYVNFTSLVGKYPQLQEKSKNWPIQGIIFSNELKVIGGQFDYEVVEGSSRSGGYGTVVRCQQNETTFARKTVLCKDFREDEILVPFRMALHTNIVKYFGVLLSNGDVQILMEFIEGKTLELLIYDSSGKKIKLSDHYVFNLIHQSASGLEHFHGSGFKHRDMKPNNMALQGRTVKILDCGGACSMTEWPCTNITRKFMSPEGLKGACKADIYALGCVLWYLLEGKYHPDQLPIPIPKQWSCYMRTLARNMLEIDEQKRWSAQQVIDNIKEIQRASTSGYHSKDDDVGLVGAEAGNTRQLPINIPDMKLLLLLDVRETTKIKDISPQVSKYVNCDFYFTEHGKTKVLAPNLAVTEIKAIDVHFP